jgi:hypothetical protein
VRASIHRASSSDILENSIGTCVGDRGATRFSDWFALGILNKLGFHLTADSLCLDMLDASKEQLDRMATTDCVVRLVQILCKVREALRFDKLHALAVQSFN